MSSKRGVIQTDVSKEAIRVRAALRLQNVRVQEDSARQAIKRRNIRDQNPPLIRTSTVTVVPHRFSNLDSHISSSISSSHTP